MFSRWQDVVGYLWNFRQKINRIEKFKTLAIVLEHQHLWRIKMTKFAESLRSERCKGICAVHTRTTWATCRASWRYLLLNLFSLAQTAQSAFCTFFIFFPPGSAAPLWSYRFFAGALFFAQITLRRSGFRGFQIGFKRRKGMWRTHVNLIDVVNSFQTSISLRTSATIQPRTSPWKCAKRWLDS